MLVVDGVRFAYEGGPAFAFDLRLERGEIVTLSGASGSGKSTLVDLVCGFLAPLAGDILWEGRSILGFAPARRPVSALFQTTTVRGSVVIRKRKGGEPKPGQAQPSSLAAPCRFQPTTSGGGSSPRRRRRTGRKTSRSTSSASELTARANSHAEIPA